MLRPVLTFRRRLLDNMKSKVTGKRFRSQVERAGGDRDEREPVKDAGNTRPLWRAKLEHARIVSKKLSDVNSRSRLRMNCWLLVLRAGKSGGALGLVLRGEAGSGQEGCLNRTPPPPFFLANFA